VGSLSEMPLIYGMEKGGRTGGGGGK